MQYTSNIALLFFARTPYSDTKRKSFASNKLHMEVVSHLHIKTFQKLCETGLPVIVSNEHTQKSRSLAKNLSQAVAGVFQKGYQKVIVVGNDCPDLNNNTLQKAIKSLNEGSNVLGPDMNGGNYLIGVDKSGFCIKAFENALRDKSKVHNKLCALLSKSDAPFVILDRKHDINNEPALREYVKSSGKLNSTYTFLRKVYFASIGFIKANSGYISMKYAPIFSLDHSRRGPPIHV